MSSVGAWLMASSRSSLTGIAGSDSAEESMPTLIVENAEFGSFGTSESA